MKQPAVKDNVAVNVLVPRAIYSMIASKAKGRLISVSGYIRGVLKDHCDQNGGAK